jgi:hypothetical protein
MKNKMKAPEQDKDNDYPSYELDGENIIVKTKNFYLYTNAKAFNDSVKRTVQKLIKDLDEK